MVQATPMHNELNCTHRSSWLGINISRGAHIVWSLYMLLNWTSNKGDIPIISFFFLSFFANVIQDS
jgi:hypothetical protein